MDWRITPLGKDGPGHVLDIPGRRSVMRYVVFKARSPWMAQLDGSGRAEKELSDWIIPHTYEATALREAQKGRRGQLEADLIGKTLKSF